MSTKGGPGNQYSTLFNPAAKYAPKPPSLLMREREEEEATQGNEDATQGSAGAKGGLSGFMTNMLGGSR